MQDGIAQQDGITLQDVLALQDGITLWDVSAFWDVIDVRGSADGVAARSSEEGDRVCQEVTG